MNFEVDSFRVQRGETVDLTQRPTWLPPVYESRKDYRRMLKLHVKQLNKLQPKFYASDTYSLLLIFQAMDTAGKDGAIRHVMSGVNPQGCQVFSFKQPSATELDHDFLWRTGKDLPERGRIGIFNRSYYEEVLVVRVHPEILEAQRLPPSFEEDSSIWEKRFESIRSHERHLYANGTRILKFFLHVSRDEQRKRLLERIDNANKNWKFSSADIEERGYWDDYQRAYEECITATSTHHAPWYIVPADDKKNARLYVSRIVGDALMALDIEYPEVSEEARAEMVTARAKLVAD
jgi:PPK2 family polyphosphate:nucleotide phosphotransferase